MIVCCESMYDPSPWVSCGNDLVTYDVKDEARYRFMQAIASELVN
jgi:hypothetical protein